MVVAKMKCFTCQKRTNVYNADKEICAACREVLKVDLVNMILGLDPVYLSENNRNKKGRKPKLTATQKNDVYWEHRRGVSMGKLSKKYGVSKSTIFNTIQKESQNQPK